MPDKQTLLVDFGSGLGYLSKMLFENYGFRVLGIEGCASNCETAIKSQMTPEYKENVKYVTHFIAENSLELIKTEIKSHSLKKDDSIKAGIVGLHACADLTINAIRIFFEMPECNYLIIMPCCYHRMTLKDEITEEFLNLPVSNTMKNILTETKGDPNIINVAFARLACQQSAIRWKKMSKEEHIQHGKNMFERAFVELIPLEGERIVRNPNTRKIDAITFESVQEKYQLADTNGKVIPWSSEHESRFEKYLQQYPDGAKLSQYIKCLQNCIQSLCEQIIMLDRHFYVQELAVMHKIQLKQLEYKKIVNDDLSPRGYVLIVHK